jgi:phenylacetate-CoA ligase
MEFNPVRIGNTQTPTLSMHPEINEAQRFPLLTPAGRRFLHRVREHPQAPRWNWPNGEQLDAAGLERVREFARALAATRVFGPTGLPAWLPQFVDFCREEVPFYRRRSVPGTPFHAIPSCSRDDLAPRVWEFVPDSLPLDQLIVFSSSGTTGHPAKMPTHPYTAACGIPLLEHALAPYGIGFPRGVGQMALANVAAYPGAYTTAVVVSYLDEAGCIRVNLCPEDWRATSDCRAFLDAWPVPVILGDPLAFAKLAEVAIDRAPQALVSSVTMLTDALASDLEARFGCPVLDLYALTEAGIVAKKVPTGHAILPHDLYVEILDEHDQPCPAGVRGEVTLTGGRNPFAPLLRYRTGDFAALAWHDGRPVLHELEGRQGVLFRAADGRTVHSMEISRRLRRYPLIQFTLRQGAGGFDFRYRGAVDVDALRAELAALLGTSANIGIDQFAEPVPRGRKVVQFSMGASG